MPWDSHESPNLRILPLESCSSTSLVSINDLIAFEVDSPSKQIRSIQGYLRLDHLRPNVTSFFFGWNPGNRSENIYMYIKIYIYKFTSYVWRCLKYTLQGTNVSNLWKRKNIFKSDLEGDILVSRRAYIYVTYPAKIRKGKRFCVLGILIFCLQFQDVFFQYPEGDRIPGIPIVFLHLITWNSLLSCF